MRLSSRTRGVGGRAGAANAQWSDSGAERAAVAASGRPSAPPSIHRRSEAFSPAESGSSGLGGISPLETWSQSVLSSGLPWTTTGPLEPPRAIDRGLLRLSFPLGLIGPWHFTHRAFSRGRMSRSRLGACVGLTAACRHSRQEQRRGGDDSCEPSTASHFPCDVA